MEIVALSLRVALGWLVLIVGLTKLVDRPAFETAIRRYDLLSERLVSPTATLLIAAEVGCGLLILLGVATSSVAILLALLFAGYAVAMAANLVRGRRHECGCGTSARMISWLLVARNGALAAGALVIVAWSPTALSVEALATGEHDMSHSDAVAVAVAATIAVPLIAVITESARMINRRVSLSAARRST